MNLEEAEADDALSVGRAAPDLDFADSDDRSFDGIEVLYVDLDGTLVAGDLLYEELVRASLGDPRVAFRFAYSALASRAAAKRVVSQAARLEPEHLPYSPETLELVARYREQGAQIVLATAADETAAHLVADHLGIFDRVLASDGRRNLAGRNKLEAIREDCETHGCRSFAYVGDSDCDVAVWQAAGEGWAVERQADGSSAIVAWRDRRSGWQRARSKAAGLLRLMRPHQWGKNVLVFVPAILGHAFGDLWIWVLAAIGFVCLSLVASAIYIQNDLLDLRDDRLHPTKRRRPLASAIVTIPEAFFLSAALLVAGFALALLFVGPLAGALLGLYVVATAAYSIRLKSLPLTDVFVLALLYVFRVIFGGAITGIEISDWLLGLSLFLFLSLACCKRRVEMERNPHVGTSRRPYLSADVPIIRSLGVGAGLVAAALAALYVHDVAAAELYQRTQVLWACVPLLLYWICRTWLLAERGEMRCDPLVFAYRDPTSYAIAGTLAVCFFLAGPR